MENVYACVLKFHLLQYSVHSISRKRPWGVINLISLFHKAWGDFLAFLSSTRVLLLERDSTLESVPYVVLDYRFELPSVLVSFFWQSVKTKQKRAVAIKSLEELLILTMSSIIFNEEDLGWLGCVQNTPEEQVWKMDCLSKYEPNDDISRCSLWPTAQRGCGSCR